MTKFLYNKKRTLFRRRFFLNTTNLQRVVGPPPFPQSLWDWLETFLCWLELKGKEWVESSTKWHFITLHQKHTRQLATRSIGASIVFQRNI